MPTRVEFTGSKAVIELYVLEGGECPADEYLQSLDGKSRQKVDTLFALMAQNGQIRNKEQFKKLEGCDGIFEFKRHQIRLLCFCGKGRPQHWVITHGVTKKQDKHAKADIERAKAYMKLYFGEK